MGFHRMGFQSTGPDRKVNWNHCDKIPVVWSPPKLSEWCNKAGGRHNEFALWPASFLTIWLKPFPGKWSWTCQFLKNSSRSTLHIPNIGLNNRADFKITASLRWSSCTLKAINNFKHQTKLYQETLNSCCEMNSSFFTLIADLSRRCDIKLCEILDNKVKLSHFHFFTH